MNTDNSLSLPPENVLYVKPAPILLFRRSWAREHNHAPFIHLILPKDQEYIISNVLSPKQVHETDDRIMIVPVPSKLYCLVDAPKGLDLRELTQLNNCPVVSYTGYAPECEGTVVVIELLD